MAEVDGVMPDLEEAVRSRYAKGAYTAEQNLCCPATYNPELLAAIPDEVLERDYGCGDPTHHLHPGETVLDLGSGAGKVCFLACQVVGPSGQVLGVDMNDEMLAVARRNAPEVARRVGYANVEFRKGKFRTWFLTWKSWRLGSKKTPSGLLSTSAVWNRRWGTCEQPSRSSPRTRLTSSSPTAC